MIRSLMSECRKIRAEIKDIDSYLKQFNHLQRSPELEKLTSQALSLIFRLHLFSMKTDNKETTNKVVWLGQDGNNPQNAPADGADAIIYTKDFQVLIEVTESTNVKQWEREFSRAIKHLDRYITKNKRRRDNTYLLLIIREISIDTYLSIRPKIDEGFHISFLTFTDISRILQACDLAIQVRHSKIGQLLGSLARDVLDTPTLPVYNKKATHTISEWRKSLLKDDQLAYVGVKSYNLFKNLTPMKHLNASYIATELFTQKEVKAYFKILNEPLLKEYVYKGMLTLGFAYEVGIKQIDPILTLVSLTEIEERLTLILKNVREN